MIKLTTELQYEDELVQLMAVREYHTVAFLAKAAARFNIYINLKKIKGGLPKYKHCIGNHHSENCWTKYLYKKQEFNN